jgi:hypothetical protein
MKETKMSLSRDDEAHKTRLVAVLSVLTKDCGGLEAVSEYCQTNDLTVEEKRFLSKVLNYWKANSIIINPLVVYLTSLEECVSTHLDNKINAPDAIPENGDIVNAIKLIQMLQETEQPNKNISMGHFVGCLYAEWFEGLRYWGRKQ